MAFSRFLDAATAAERLGISRATLYAYVSRGLVRAKPHPDDPRARLYREADIAALERRKKLQHRPAEAAATTLDWGMPSLETAISSIEDGKLAYRGEDAITLSHRATFEEIAALLWQGVPPPQTPSAKVREAEWSFLREQLHEATGVARATALLALPQDDDTQGVSEDRLITQAGGLVRQLAEAVAPDLAPGITLHDALAASWKRPEAAEVIRRALVLLADHEMNASTFAVRVVASTGASLRTCLLGGLSALSGPLHGGATARARAFVDSVSTTESAEDAVRARLDRGEVLAGFGHRLYPEGDPRAAELLAHVRCPETDRLIAAVDSVAGLKPTIDMALVAVEISHGLHKGAALDLFTIGRAAGWMAHAIEQRLRGHLIRPRARFVGDAGL